MPRSETIESPRRRGDIVPERIVWTAAGRVRRLDVSDFRKRSELAARLLELLRPKEPAAR